MPSTAWAMARIWSGVVPQQPPRMLTKPLAANSWRKPSGRLGLFVIVAEGIGQAGIRVAADVGRGDLGQFGQVRPHLVGAQSAVDADAEGLGMGDGGPEGVDGLPRQRAAAAVGDCHRNHQRQRHTSFVEQLLDGDDRRLGVEGVEDGLEHQ